MRAEPSLSEGTSFPHPAVGSERSGVRREDDILFQWRLRRKMEQARQWSQEAPSHNSVLHIPLSPNQVNQHYSAYQEFSINLYPKVKCFSIYNIYFFNNLSRLCVFDQNACKNSNIVKYYCDLK